MARIRAIKAEFWTDTVMVDLSVYARLFYIGLWNFADDFGCVGDEPRRLKMQILPADQVDPEAIIYELVAAGRLERMESSDGKPFLLIPRFRDHQKIDTRNAPRFGDPDTWSPRATPVPAVSRPITPDHAGPLPATPVPDPGREGKGREGIQVPTELVTNHAAVVPFAREPSESEISKWAEPAKHVVAKIVAHRFPPPPQSQRPNLLKTCMELLAVGWDQDDLVKAAVDASALTANAIDFQARRSKPPPGNVDVLKDWLAGSSA